MISGIVIMSLIVLQAIGGALNWIMLKKKVPTDKFRLGRQGHKVVNLVLALLIIDFH